MRIIHIIPAITEEASGPSYSVVNLCNALIAEQCRVTLTALDWAPLKKAPSFLKAFPIAAGPRRLGRSPAMYRWLSKSCTAGAIDILHNHGMWQMNAIYPVWASVKSRVQLVCSPRGAFSKWAMQNGSIAKLFFWPLLQKPALKRAACFHATAESEYHDIRRLGFHQPVAIIPNGIRVPEEPNRSPCKQQHTLLFLGRIHPVKGLDMLLPAWQALQKSFPNWRLVIAGDDDGYYGTSGYLSKIMLQARQLDLKRVEFQGKLCGNMKWQAYRNASLFVLPSYSENFGMTVAEALSMGTPAVVSKGAPWEGLRHHNAGWWCDMGVDPLIACLKEAMSGTSEDLDAMGERGRRWMQNDFSWAGIAKKMVATYRWLCDKSLPVPTWVRLD